MLYYLFLEPQKYHHLSSIEIAEIRLLKDHGMSYREIAKALNISKSQIGRLLTSKSYNVKKEHRGRKSCLTARIKMKVGRLAKYRLMSASEIKGSLGLEASLSTIQRYLSKDLSLIYGRFASKPQLTKAHEE